MDSELSVPPSVAATHDRNTGVGPDDARFLVTVQQHLQELDAPA